MAVLSVVDTFTVTPAATSVTRSSLSFGADVPERLIAVSLSWFLTSVQANPTVTIGGVTATLAKSSITTTNNTGAALYYAHVTGTSGNVVVTFAGTCSQFQIATYRLEVASATPVASNATPQAGSAIGLTATIPISVIPNGIVLATVRDTGTTTSGFTHSYDGIDTETDDVIALASATHAKSHVQTTETATRNIGYARASLNSGKFIAAACWTSSAALAAGSGAVLLCGV